VSKPTAKKAAPAKKAAAKAPKAVKAAKPAAKAKPKARPVKAKPATKVAKKVSPPAKPKAKPAAKAPPKSLPKAAKKAPTAPATRGKAAAKPPAKPAAVAAPAKGAKLAPTVNAKPTPPASHSASTAIKPSAPTAATPTRGRGKSAPVPVAPPAPIVGVTASRFADRFGTALPSRPVVVEHNRPPIKIDSKLVNVWKSKSAKELNDAEVLAMPDAEYMNDKQLEFFRLRLTGLKDDLLSNAGETTEHLREDTTIVPDPADRATIEEEHALELRTRDRERKLLKKISQSLTRIESGEYGFCDETGEPIGVARLLARPTATLSLEAQQRREMKQKMFGD
jgi:DnaK suppressor protein